MSASNWSHSTRVLVIVMGAALLLESGCSSARRGAPVTGLVEADEQVKKGEIAFYKACDSCHVGGAAGLGPAINDKPLPGFMIRLQVRNGVGAMPAFSKAQVSDAELDAIVAYLEALRQSEWPQAYLSPQAE